jgi:hypothetical protein
VSDDRKQNVIFFGACIIAAVRLARETEIKTSPRVMARIGDSVAIARLVWQYLERDRPKTSQAAQWNQNT